jgi:hypothetical protein
VSALFRNSKDPGLSDGVLAENQNYPITNFCLLVSSTDVLASQIEMLRGTGSLALSSDC